MLAPLRRLITALLILAALPARFDAQRAPIGDAIKDFVSVDAPVVALTNARVIDGTGAPAREGYTLVLRDGLIAAMGPTASTPPPAGARVIDLTGKTVLPGLVMVHEHLFYPTGPRRLRTTRPELRAPLPGRRRDHDAHRRQHERLHGHHPREARGGRRGGRARHRRHRRRT